MELESHTTKQAYLQLLADTLRKKEECLTALMNITEVQESIITSENFEEDRFINTISLKDEQLQNLIKLDSGFEHLFESIKEELTTRKEKYVDEIMLLRELITEITDLSVKLQALEKRNKTKLDVLLAQKRKEIKSSRVGSKTAASYYKTMAKQQESQSFFYDKKK